MKTIIVILFGSIAALIFAYASLYIENQRLHEEFIALQEKFNVVVLSEGTDKANKPLLTEEAVKPLGNQKKTSSQPMTNSINESLEQNLKISTERKYANLFSILRLSGQNREAILALIMDRERVLTSSSVNHLTTETEIKASMETQRMLIAQIDDQIGMILNQDDMKKYDLLKDSSYEQNQINNFYNNLTNKTGLSQEKRDILLLSKLEQQRSAANLLETSAEEINNASPSDKIALAERFKESLRIYNDNYLQIAKQILNEEQFSALRDNEQKQYEEVWQDIIAGWQQE
jgi:hypothetical protein